MSFYGTVTLTFLYCRSWGGLLSARCFARLSFRALFFFAWFWMLVWGCGGFLVVLCWICCCGLILILGFLVGVWIAVVLWCG